MELEWDYNGIIVGLSWDYKCDKLYYDRDYHGITIMKSHDN